jgi:hypothetical protein
MPVDPKASSRDKMIALGAVAFLVVSFIIIYIVFQLTSAKPEEEKKGSTPLPVKTSKPATEDE